MLVSNIIADVRKTAAERPSVVYLDKDCRYAAGNCSDGSIGCIFGQVLSNLGVDVKEYDATDNGYGENIVPDINHILNEDSFVGNERDIHWCDLVQEYQDSGLSWEEAVKTADDEIVNLYPEQQGFNEDEETPADWML